jgi:3-oxoadipate enol-lactonase/4-carboxymuconolactone decarboxylase
VFERIDGQDVFTVTFGSGSEVVVGVAGSFGSTEIWQPPFELLSASRRTVGYDHYGTGQTHVPQHLVTFEHQVQLLGRILALNADAEVLILAADSSMTTVAIEAARRWPDSVSGLVLVSGGLDFAPSEQVERFVQGLRHAFEPTVKAFVQMAIPEDTTGRFQRWLYDIIARTGGERAAALVESFYGVDVRPQLTEITMSTVVIHGELDSLPTSPLAAAQEMSDSITEAKLIVLPDTGHVPTLTRPEAVVDAIDQLLQ